MRQHWTIATLDSCSYVGGLSVCLSVYVVVPARLKMWMNLYETFHDGKPTAALELAAFCRIHVEFLKLGAQTETVQSRADSSSFSPKFTLVF